MSDKPPESNPSNMTETEDPYASFNREQQEKPDPANLRTKYPLTADSHPQPGVPQGKIVRRVWNTSQIYPDSKTDYWIYIPAQYDASQPACLMVFQDGQGFFSAVGSVRAPFVFDNLIHKGEMPVTIGVFINPSAGEFPWDHREKQYTPLNDTFARFLIEEILVEVAREYNLSDEAEGRAICGMSDGGLCSFTVAWERPDYFSKVISHIGSFTRLKGGSEYPYLIRKTRGNPKPLRIFLQDGENDINLAEGDWVLANRLMESALQFARWDHRVVWGVGGHDLFQGGAIFPDTMRWIWRDFPGVRNSETEPKFDTAIGQWRCALNNLGLEHAFDLYISLVNDALEVRLVDDRDGELQVVEADLDCDILTFEYRTPPSQMNFGKGAPTDREPRMSAWARLSGNSLSGAMSSNADQFFDLALKGERK